MKNVNSCCARIRAGLRSHLPLLLAAVALTAFAAADDDKKSPTVSVVAISYKPPSTILDVVVAIPKRVDRQARLRNRDHALRVTVTYLSLQNTVETVDSGPLLIRTDTTFLAEIDKKTVIVLVKVPLGTASGPGQTPNYSATAQLILASGPDDDDDDD